MVCVLYPIGCNLWRGGDEKKAAWNHATCEGAVNGARTRDPQLGKLMLYQLSYYRMLVIICYINLHICPTISSNHGCLPSITALTCASPSTSTYFTDTVSPMLHEARFDGSRSG